MELWQRILGSSIRQPEDLARLVPGIDVNAIKMVTGTYPMFINPYYLSLLQNPQDPIGRQCIPALAEVVTDEQTTADPLSEESDSPVPCLVHRYPDRVLFQVSSQCAMNCRFCTRKRKVGTDWTITSEMRRNAIDYIANHPEVRDVIISGGDPFLLTDETIDGLLQAIRAIPHVEIVRIGTRTPAVLPQRITPHLVSILKKYHPLFINVHFEHPRELTPAACLALSRLADAGIPLGNQSVLLAGVNDAPGVFVELNRKLLANRVRPYYLYQCDPVVGSNHFRTTVATGMRIMRELRGNTSGLAVPQYVIDAPGGGGKIPVLPEETSCYDGRQTVLTNYQGRHFTYSDPELTAVPDGSMKRRARKKAPPDLLQPPTRSRIQRRRRAG